MKEQKILKQYLTVNQNPREKNNKIKTKTDQTDPIYYTLNCSTKQQLRNDKNKKLDDAYLP